jgi:hypothetical protein
MLCVGWMRARRAHRRVERDTEDRMDKNSGRRRLRSIEWVADCGIDRRDVYGCFTARMTVSCRPIVMDGNIRPKPWETYWRRRCYKTIPMKLMFETTSRWMMSSHVLLYGLNLEWKEYIASWVGIEYSDGASGLYAPCRAMRICPFKRIDTRILTPDNIEKG